MRSASGVIIYRAAKSVGARKCCRCQRAIAVCATWLLAPSVLAAASLSGSIQNAGQVPLDRAGVTIWNARGESFQTTSLAGAFFFRDVPNGDYLLKAGKHGLATLYGAVRLHGDTIHELNPVLVAGDEGTIKAARPPQNRAAERAAPSSKPKDIKGSRLTHKVAPAYPASARRAGIGGQVCIAVTLRADGTLDDLVVLSAPDADLAVAALVAVRQWRYTPTTMDGRPVEIFFTIDVNFRP